MPSAAWSERQTDQRGVKRAGWDDPARAESLSAAKQGRLLADAWALEGRSVCSVACHGGWPVSNRRNVRHRDGDTILVSRARTLWRSQCGVVPSIREKYGLQAALDYLVSEKLLSFAEAAASHPDFAHELPVFVAEIRRLFTPAEIKEHLAILVPRAEEAARADADADAEADEDDFETISPQKLDARLGRLSLMKHLLEADHLGTS